MKNETNTILLHALGTLWPKNEPKPAFKAVSPHEWACFDRHTDTHGATQEEALYRFAVLCHNASGDFVPSSDFGPVLDFLGEFVDDPIIDENERPCGPFVEMDEIVNQFLKP